ncbi:MAG: RsmB/NOP family class I SAM-dependent RNA methyltransferase [Nanoarchaeota archaeon]|nr:RsmB/NOP family class I SAM-dependent RNA methyltransferase [Nanoarchaeota archaeon]
MKHNYDPKPIFIKRMKLLLKGEEDLKRFLEVAKTTGKKSIRVNTLKISPEELIKRLKNKNWNISQPFPNFPEIIIINDILQPGELGKTKEHILGYYYVQEITSMMPILALDPKEQDIILDLCAAPGSKTTQTAATMKNKGTIIANDVSIGRISVLCANLERTGATNTIVTRHEGLNLIKRLKELKFNFDKILVDAPCSGEGNIRVSPRTYLEWSENLIKNLSNRQKQLASNALNLLKVDGEMVYSTCTHAPEENEEVIQYILENHDVKIEPIIIPLKTRPGILEWNNKKFHPDMKNAIRIYHHDEDLEGFFICKLKKLSEKK